MISPTFHNQNGPAKDAFDQLAVHGQVCRLSHDVPTGSCLSCKTVVQEPRIPNFDLTLPTCTPSELAAQRVVQQITPPNRYEVGATDLQIALPCSPEVCIVAPVSNGPVRCGNVIILTKRQRIWSSGVTLTLPTNIACPSSEPPKLIRGRPGWSGSGSVPRMRSST